MENKGEFECMYTWMRIVCIHVNVCIVNNLLLTIYKDFIAEDKAGSYRPTHGILLAYYMHISTFANS